MLEMKETQRQKTGSSLIEALRKSLRIATLRQLSIRTMHILDTKGSKWGLRVDNLERTRNGYIREIDRYRVMLCPFRVDTYYYNEAGILTGKLVAHSAAHSAEYKYDPPGRLFGKLVRN